MMTKWNSFKCLCIVSLVSFSLTAACLPALSAAPAAYDFSMVAQFGGPAPGGGFFTNNVAPFCLNKRGDLAFHADVQMTQGGTDLGQGIFVATGGQLLQVARVAEQAPGGGTFAKTVWPATSINRRGDVVFAMALVPFTIPPPAGVNSGLYRFSASDGTLSALVVPYLTPAPGGGMFQGVHIQPTVNKRGEVVFCGIVNTDRGTHVPGEDYLGLGMGVFRVDKAGQIVSVASPGDPAPGGGTLDYATRPSINDHGDIAFDGHIAGDECLNQGGGQSRRLGCPSRVYFIPAGGGQIQAIAGQGDPAPGGGRFRFASGPKINNRGEIVFLGDLTDPPAVSQRTGVFLYSSGQIVSVVRPGDAMPGGGNAVTAGISIGDFTLTGSGEVAVNVTLDSDVDGDGKPDTGVYVMSRGGALSLVVRTGTVIPSIGTVIGVTKAIIGDRGQVAFTAQLSDGRTVLLVATPR